MRPSLPEPRETSASSLSALENLFWAALELPEPDRPRFLEAQCAGRPELQREVERMLAAHSSAGGFLQVPLPRVLTADLPRGRLARWHLLQPIGEGGLGVVYRAVCESDGVRLEAAVKILRPGFDTGQFRDHFVQERQILADLDHPGIVRVLDCGADEEGRSFLAMEFVHGRPLDVWLEAEKPPLKKRLDLFERICQAVAYLHSRLIVHGDIKPSNVMVTAQHGPKLLDFGAARLMARETVGDLTRMLLTPLYASPEQKRGEGPSVCGDVYSLGRLLQETIAPARRTDLAAIQARCLAEDPGERYQSVPDLLEDLRRLREGLPLRARPATVFYVSRRFLRRNWALTAMTILLVGSLAGGWWNADRHSKRAALAAEEASRQRRAALDQEGRAEEQRLRAEASAREAIANADRLDALVGDLIDDSAADPNILDQQQRALESSLLRATATLQALPGPPRWRELSVAYRRVAMSRVHRGEFTAAAEPMAQARAAALAWKRADNSVAARRNALVTKLYEIRLDRSSGNPDHAYKLANEALAELRALPKSVQNELNGSVWVETTRLAAARDLIRQNKLDQVPPLLETAVRNSHAVGLLSTRNLAIYNLIWTLRRLNRLDEARNWCYQAKSWQAAEPRQEAFCAEPITRFTSRQPLFTATVGLLPPKELTDLRARIDQLVKDLREDPGGFRLRIDLGRAYARLTSHYLANEEPELARRSLSQAAAIRDSMLERDAESPVVKSFQTRVANLEKLAGQQ